MALVSGLKTSGSLAARRVPPSEALRINYVYLKTFGSLVARAIETSGALRNPERILSDENIP